VKPGSLDIAESPENGATSTRKPAMRPEAVFLVLGLVFGLLFLLVTPPFQIPDETAHFDRAYQVSQGGLTPQRQGAEVGGILPVSVSDVGKRFEYLWFHSDRHITVAQILDAGRVPLNASDTAFYGFPNSALYSPINYLPQALAIAVGRLFNLPPLYLMYLARLAALLAWLALIYLAIRIIPTGKWALLAVSLIPMMMFLAPSVSADSFVFALTAFAVALTVRLACHGGELSRRDLIAIFCVSVALSLIKLPYSLAFLIFLFIPVTKFNNRKVYAAFWASTLIVCLGFIGVAVVMGLRFYAPLDHAGIVVSEQMQLRFVEHDPLKFVETFLRTWYRHGVPLVGDFLGTLGWLDTVLPLWLRLLALADLCVALLSIDGICRGARAFYRWVSALVPLGIFLAINLLLYLSWSAIGARVIDGLQGRYFLPVAALSIPLLTTRKHLIVKMDDLRLRACLAAAQVVILSSTLVVLLHRYY
jgi:uncharacterized membrane protein